MHIDDGALVGASIGSCSIINGAGGHAFIAVSIIDTDDTPSLEYQNYKFIQTEELTEAGIAVHPYGAFIIPDTGISGAKLVVEYNDTLYESDEIAEYINVVGTPIAFTPVEDGGGGDNEGGGGGDAAS